MNNISYNQADEKASSPNRIFITPNYTNESERKGGKINKTNVIYTVYLAKQRNYKS